MDKKPTTKLMILCWGFSIHAKRRIEIFANDSRFNVIVISTHNYNLPNTRTVLLKGTEQNPATNSSESTPQIKSGIVNLLKRLGLKKIIIVLISPWKFLHDLNTAITDFHILSNTVRDIKPNVVLLQTLMYPSYLAYFLPRSIPRVVTFWNGDVTWWAKWNGIDRWFKKQIVTYGARQATAITVNSQLAFDACLQYKADPSRINLIGYPGVDTNKFKLSDKTMAKQQLGITAKHVVLWPRGLGSYINGDIFIQAAAKAVQKYPDILFIIMKKIGESKCIAYQKMMQDLNVVDNFLWTGEVEFDKMPLYYNSSDVMVSLSDNDSRPNVMLEAMACGVPVIMGDIPPIREWVTNNYNGYLIPRRDADILAQKIITTLDPANRQIHQNFVNKNLQLICKRADSQKSIKDIRNLLITVAQSNR